MQHTSIRIPAELLRELDDLAARQNRSRTGQLIWLVRQAVVADGRPDPLIDARPDDDGPGGAPATSPERTPVPAPNRPEAA